MESKHLRKSSYFPDISPFYVSPACYSWTTLCTHTHYYRTLFCPFAPGFRIRITLVRIRFKLFTLVWIWIRIQLFISMRIRFRSLLLMKVSLHVSILSVNGRVPHRSICEPRKRLNFDYNADPDPATHSNAASNPASNINAEPDPKPCPLISFLTCK
jgi:hypothetical protein